MTPSDALNFIISIVHFFSLWSFDILWVGKNLQRISKWIELLDTYIELKSNKLMKYDIELSIFDMNYPGSKSSFGCPEGHQ